MEELKLASKPKKQLLSKIKIDNTMKDMILYEFVFNKEASIIEVFNFVKRFNKVNCNEKFLYKLKVKYEGDIYRGILKQFQEMEEDPIIPDISNFSNCNGPNNGIKSIQLYIIK